MDLREMEWKGVEWMIPAKDGDQWWALVNMAMNPQVP
jgi:hypothetical protein